MSGLQRSLWEWLMYLICWLASLRTRSTSLPLISSSLVSVSMVSLSEWISWSRSVMRLQREHTSVCSSEIRARSSCSCMKRVNGAERITKRLSSSLGDINLVSSDNKKQRGWKTVTCLWLWSIALSSSRLVAVLSLRWICLKCSMDVAWRWLSSARSDAAR